jgi:hypothetical protein
MLAKGADSSLLCGPLKRFTVRKPTSAEMYQFLGDIARELGKQLYDTHVYRKQFEAFEAAAIVTPATQKTGIVPLKEYTARDICLELRGTAPLQRKANARRFLNCLIDWDVKLRDAEINEGTVGKASVSLIPWEDEGFDTSIHCTVDLKSFPELLTAKDEAPFRIIGRIESATDWVIELTDVKLFPIQDIGGTRVRCLLQVVSDELGQALCKFISNRAIEASIIAQLNAGRVKGLTLMDNKTIHPEMERQSKPYKLLVLRTCKHLIESNPALMQSARHKLSSLESEVYHLENY